MIFQMIFFLDPSWRSYVGSGNKAEKSHITKSPDELDRLFERFRAIIDTWKDMTMDIDHTVHLLFSNKNAQGRP